MEVKVPTGATSTTANNSVGEIIPFCDCGKLTERRTCWRGAHIGRRFWACTNYYFGNGCKTKEWIDPQLCPRGREVVAMLLKEKESLENHCHDLQFVGDTFTQPTSNSTWQDELISMSAQCQEWKSFAQDVKELYDVERQTNARLYQQMTTDRRKLRKMSSIEQENMFLKAILVTISVLLLAYLKFI